MINATEPYFAIDENFYVVFLGEFDDIESAFEAEDKYPRNLLWIAGYNEMSVLRDNISACIQEHKP